MSDTRKFLTTTPTTDGKDGSDLSPTWRCKSCDHRTSKHPGSRVCPVCGGWSTYYPEKGSEKELRSETGRGW